MSPAQLAGLIRPTADEEISGRAPSRQTQGKTALPQRARAVLNPLTVTGS